MPQVILGTHIDNIIISTLNDFFKCVEKNVYFVWSVQDLKKPGDELFTNFSMDEMGFSPAIKPPGKRLGKKGTPSTITLPLDTVLCQENLDFFTALKK